ncbi:MAG: hypothetical protein ABIP33_08225 [Pseudolysinimonas sp.]
MTARRDLPRQLPTPFAVRDAIDAGIPASRLRAHDLRRPFHGVRVAADSDDSLALQCRALMTRFRAQDAFCGPTAARLWGMPLPPELGSAPDLHVSSLRPAAALRRQGVIGSTRATCDPVRLAGLPVLAPFETALSLGRLIGVADLVAVLDFIITGDLGRGALSSTEKLSEFLTTCDRHPGLGPLRAAAALARVGAWSRPETLLRLILMGAGIPEPELNVRLVHPEGRIVIPDLAWPSYRVAAEYNGLHHESGDQRVHDLRRADDFCDIGWSTVNVERAELFQNPRSAVKRVARRLAGCGWTPPRRLRWTISDSTPRR